MQKDGLQFFVKVNGRIVDEYKHKGKLYIEGRRGSEYELLVKNNLSLRRNLVLSVDGLNILTGDNTWKKGYVVDGWSTISVPGWRIDDGKVAAFEFGSVRGSYNQHNDSGDKKNIGVIGLMAYDEIPQVKVQPISWNLNPNYHFHYDSYPQYRGIGASPGYYTFGSAVGKGTSLGAVGSGGTSTCSNSLGAASDSWMDEVDGDAMFVGAASAAPVKQSLGTEWGKETAFATREVDYKFKTEPCATFAFYYDDRAGLLKRGINIRNKEQVVRDEPNPFPGYRDGCPYPK